MKINEKRLKTHVLLMGRVRYLQIMDTQTPPTDDELAAMQARVDAATPGPWSASLLYDVTDTTCIDECDFGFIGDINFPVERAGIEYAEYAFMQPDSPQQKQIHADAVFIAAARRDMQTLLDEVARLRNENANLHRVIQASLPIVDLDALE